LQHYHRPRLNPIEAHRKPDMSPDYQWRDTMKKLMLAAVAALSVSVSVASLANAASSVAGDEQATRMQQTGTYSGE
jgi:hypothetical protein